MNNDINEQFHAAAEEYANRLAAKREAAENPGKTRRDNADAFAEHLEAILAQQSNNNII